MGWDRTSAAIFSQKKERKFPIARLREYQKGYRQLYLQGSPWLWEQNFQETIILLPQFTTQWCMLNDACSHSGAKRVL